MKALPPQRIFDFDQEQEYWREILNMCHQPSYSQGEKVRLVENVVYSDEGILKKGGFGVVRPFNPVDYKRLYNEYQNWLHYPIGPAPKLDRTFDYFSYSTEKKSLTIWHCHIALCHFEYYDTQLKLF